MSDTFPEPEVPSVDTDAVFGLVDNLRARFADDDAPSLVVPDLRSDYATEMFGVAAGLVDGLWGVMATQLESVAMTVMSAAIETSDADIAAMVLFPGGEQTQ